MNDKSPIEQQAAVAKIQTKRPFSLIWIVPLVALLIGGWLAFKAINDKGPVITITFATADGLEAGKTKIKYREVDIGLVETIALDDNVSKVVVTAQMIKGSGRYLTDQTKFWVVRPRISGSSVSGLSTMLSGAYIGIDGSDKGAPSITFTGLEVPPVVTVGQPGRHFILKADMLGSLDVGAPVYYRQIQVGQVVSYNFDESGKSVDIKIFIEAPHHAKASQNTRFWNASGIDVSLNAQGLRVDTQSMISIVSGGIAFDNVPRDTPPGEEAKENETFPLYDDEDAIHEKKYSIRNYWMLLFNESVRGLSVGAPVELYGIKIGEVVDLSLEFDLDKKKFQVPVLIAIEPERINSANKEEVLKNAEKHPGDLVKELVEQQGLRAQLQSGNLLTGQLMINMTFDLDAPKTTLGSYAGHLAVPTIPGSFAKLQDSVGKIITNLEKVQFDQIGSDLQQALKETKATVAEIGNLSKTLNRETSPHLQATLIELQKTLVEVQKGMGANSPLNYNVTRSMEELAMTLRSLRELTDTLNKQPQSILFGKEKKDEE